MDKTATISLTNDIDTATFIVNLKSCPSLKIEVTREDEGYNIYAIDNANKVVDVLNIDDFDLY